MSESDKSVNKKNPQGPQPQGMAGISTLQRIDDVFKKYGIFAILHIVILIVSILLVVFISWDTFNNMAFYRQSKFLDLQPLVCIFFLADFFIELILSPGKKRYLASHWVFFLVSIPWLTVINYFHFHFSATMQYAVQFIPLVRGGYALAIVVGWFTQSRISSLFISYIITLMATVYFASLAFYLFEKGINPLVVDYGAALWWACMDVTTVGSNIVAVTPVGRVLSVVLAALGMMMFPIFTVYVTDRIKRDRARQHRLSDPGIGGLPIGRDYGQQGSSSET